MHRLISTSFASVHALYVAKAERKSRTRMLITLLDELAHCQAMDRILRG